MLIVRLSMTKSRGEDWVTHFWVEVNLCCVAEVEDRSIQTLPFIAPVILFFSRLTTPPPLPTLFIFPRLQFERLTKTTAYYFALKSELESKMTL